MEFEYRLNCGQYVLHSNGSPVGPLLDEVALCLTTSCGTLHKHGKPEFVQKWLATTQAAFRKGGFQEMADELVVIQGRFPLEELNRCISTTGYALRLYEKVQAGSAPALDMHGQPMLPN